ncbi:MAG: glutathione peroxidase [Prevotellaceae bacterium]|nr:glutathione peroxidase [Prevotellaceae bacterium]MDY3366153.1 glutathione peroxidase [Prevotella sp.]
MNTIYDFKAKTGKGKELDFSAFEGKVLLIVNTASKCGFTPQFEGLEELNKKYREEGLVVVGFPCNQFGSQDPGSNEEISGFCQLNYGVSFQIMEKVNVNGDDAAPIFKYLKKAAGGFITDSIKWNFTKFLISRDGKTIRRYAPITTPKKLEKDIVEMLKS